MGRLVELYPGVEDPGAAQESWGNLKSLRKGDLALRNADTVMTHRPETPNAARRRRCYFYDGINHR